MTKLPRAQLVAVFTFGSAGMLVLRRNRNDRSGSGASGKPGALAPNAWIAP
jgi:hypothetical protein